MKALTLTQPWATLVALGAKRFETRSWKVAIERGDSLRIAIHAAKGMPGEARHLFYTAPFYETLKRAHAAGLIPEEVFECDHETGWQGFADRLARGAIVAVCEVIACYRTEHILGASTASACHIDERERAFGDYSPGRYAWQLFQVRALPEPIPCRGALGLWNVPDDLLPLIDRKPEAVTSEAASPTEGMRSSVA